MSFIATASVLAEEAAKTGEGNWFPAWGFGVLGFVVLGIALWATTMINVDR